MLDKTRGGVLESKTFHGGNPSLRLDACCHHSMRRAFFLSAVVNRLPLRAHKEKTDAEPMRIRRHTFAGPDRSVRGMPVLASKSVGTSVMGSDVSLSSDVVSVYHPGAITKFTISALVRAEYQNPSMG